MMISKKRTFPPKKVADICPQSASNFLALLKDSKNWPVTLILGAGISASAGLPVWNTLLERICTAFFFHWKFKISFGKETINKPPHDMSIAFFDDFTPNEGYKYLNSFFKNDGNKFGVKPWEDSFWDEEFRKSVIKFTEHDSLLATQQIKNCIRERDWRYLVRKVVYNYDVTGNYHIRKSRLIRNLVKFCIDSKKLQTIISYNWDNVFEQEARELGFKFSPIWEGRKKHAPNSIPIYYPHGYLPLEGGPNTKLILAESDYQQEVTEVYSWSNLVQTQAFCNSLCIFLGTSMIDPNLRRLLRISAEAKSAFHYAFLPSRDQSDQFEIMRDSLFDRDLNRLGVRVVRFPVDYSLRDPYSRLPKLVDLLRKYINDEDSIWEN